MSSPPAVAGAAPTPGAPPLDETLAATLACIQAVPSFGIVGGMGVRTAAGIALETIVEHPDGALILLHHLLLPALAALREPRPAPDTEEDMEACGRRSRARASLCYACHGLGSSFQKSPASAAAAATGVVAVLSLPDAVFGEFLHVMLGCLLNRSPLGAMLDICRLLDALPAVVVYLAADAASHGSADATWGALRGVSLTVEDAAYCPAAELLECIQEAAGALGDAAALAAAAALDIEAASGLKAACNALRARAEAASAPQLQR